MGDDSYVHGVARQSGSNFYYSFFSLPKPQREAITAVYAFCRQVDDAVDLPQDGNPDQVIARWREEITRTYEGKPTQPLTRSLLSAIESFQLSKVYFDGLLDGVAMDLRMNRYPTFEALTAYCYHVAGEVGLLCMEIFGYRSERLRTYAVKLGTAFQLTNILRDVKSDAARGRIYLPQEDLERFGVKEEWILAQAEPHPHPLSLRERGEGTRLQNPLPMGEGGPPDRGVGEASFRRLMAFEAHRARGYYQEASVLPTPAERPALRAAEIMSAIYQNILNRIERRNYDVFSKRVSAPAPVKIWLALKTWWECR